MSLKDHGFTEEEIKKLKAIAKMFKAQKMTVEDLMEHKPKTTGKK